MKKKTFGKINAKILNLIFLDQWFSQCSHQVLKVWTYSINVTWELVKTQILSTESEILGIGPSTLNFNKPKCCQGDIVGH